VAEEEFPLTPRWTITITDDPKETTGAMQAKKEWCETGRGVVVPWKCDHFGHMNVRFYAEAFDDASFHIWSVIGMPIDDIEMKYGLIGVLASMKIDFLQEMKVGQLFVVESAITRVGTKSFAYTERMRNTHTGVTHATADIVEVFFDKKKRKAAEIPDDVHDLLDARLVANNG